MLFAELNREYSNLINYILVAKQNALHPSILTPANVISELSKTKRYLPPNTNYPVSLTVSNAYELMNLTSLSVYYMDSKVVFIVNIPINKNTEHVLYHLLPLPIHTRNNTFVFIKPDFDYLALSYNKLSYSPLTSIDCNTVSNITYIICPRERHIYNSYNHKICESELLLNNIELPKSCDIRMGLIENEVWYQLSEKNKWLYVVPYLTHVTIDCKKKGVFDLQINGTGFISLKSTCKAYTKSVTLNPTSDYSSSVESFITSMDIKLQNGNIDEMGIPSFDFTPLHSPISNLDELKTASFKLGQISSLVDEAVKT